MTAPRAIEMIADDSRRKSMIPKKPVPGWNRF
jgi:hypothetical protein